MLSGETMSCPPSGPRALSQPPANASPGGLTATQLGMRLLLVSLGVLFVAAAAAVLITAARTTNWRPPAATGLPSSLAVSTGLIALTSLLMQRALGALRRNRRNRCRDLLSAAGLAAGAFLLVQALGAGRLLQLESVAQAPGLFVFCYYLLLGLHGLHVVGGLVPLTWVAVQLQRGEYSSSRQEGLSLCVQYFHFLGVMWLLLLATLAAVA